MVSLNDASLLQLHSREHSMNVSGGSDMAHPLTTIRRGGYDKGEYGGQVIGEDALLTDGAELPSPDVGWLP